LTFLTEAEGPFPGKYVLRAETIRCRAALLALQAADPATIEQTFGDALALARSQGAKLLQLRVAIRFGRWLHDRGRPAEAHHLLAPLYASFTEGFDTRDLRDAKALLDELS